MPTLLGLLNYDNPYFGSGRDVFNKKHDPINIGYIRKTYKMMTDSVIVMSSFNKAFQIYKHQDTELQNNIFDPHNHHHLYSLLKANIQQYTTIKNKKFTTKNL